MTLEQAIITIKQHTERSIENVCVVYAHDGRYLVKLHKDGDKFLPTCQYKRMFLYDKGYAPEFLWTLSDTVEFVQTFITYSKPVLSIIQKRKYGEPKLIDDYDRWGYSLVLDGCAITMEEEDLTYICSKEEFNSITENIKSKIKKHLGIPKNRVYVGLRYNGEFEVTFTMKDDKIPVIKKED